MQRSAIAVVTQVLVDRNDPAFADPAKPIGSHMDEETARRRAAELGWIVREDAGRGWRRVVPSPLPQGIVEIDEIEHLVSAGYVVIACGGGGIPVFQGDDGDLQGVEAVIDKDLASSMLARELNADLFVISTGVAQGGDQLRPPGSALAGAADPRGSGDVPRRGPLRRRQHGAEDPRDHRLPRPAGPARPDHRSAQYRARARRPGWNRADI